MNTPLSKCAGVAGLELGLGEGCRTQHPDRQCYKMQSEEQPFRHLINPSKIVAGNTFCPMLIIKDPVQLAVSWITNISHKSIAYLLA